MTRFGDPLHQPTYKVLTAEELEAKRARPKKRKTRDAPAANRATKAPPDIEGSVFTITKITEDEKA